MSICVKRIYWQSNYTIHNETPSLHPGRKNNIKVHTYTDSRVEICSLSFVFILLLFSGQVERIYNPQKDFLGGTLITSIVKIIAQEACFKNEAAFS